MPSFNQIDFSKLPVPEIIEQVSYETILAEALADLRQRDPAFTATVESDPAYKLLEVFAYRELLLRQQFNARAKGALLAYAQSGDLEHLAAFYGVARLVTNPGDPTAIPPVPPTMETDEALRRRTQLALEGFSVAGPVGAYEFHALSVPGVKDVSVSSPNPGDVVVAVLSTEEAGDAGAELLADVYAALNGDDIRPLTDNLAVVAAGIVPYTLNAEIYVLPGPDKEIVRQLAEDAVTELIEASHAVGRSVYLSALIAALHVEGVDRVDVNTPVGNVVVTQTQAAYCSSITVTAEDA